MSDIIALQEQILTQLRAQQASIKSLADAITQIKSTNLEVVKNALERTTNSVNGLATSLTRSIQSIKNIEDHTDPERGNTSRAEEGPGSAGASSTPSETPPDSSGVEGGLNSAGASSTSSKTPSNSSGAGENQLKKENYEDANE